MKTLLFILTNVFAINSYAGAMSARELSKLYYSAKCESECQQGVSVEFFDTQDLFKLPPALFKKLQEISNDQAQIWGDTILEGDYVADGRTQLEQVLIIEQNAQVIGYAVTYSERAWFVGNCAYTYRNPQTLASCDEGRIYERSFVTAELNDYEVDQNQFADFKPKD